MGTKCKYCDEALIEQDEDGYWSFNTEIICKDAEAGSEEMPTDICLHYWGDGVFDCSFTEDGWKAWANAEAEELFEWQPQHGLLSDGGMMEMLRHFNEATLQRLKTEYAKSLREALKLTYCAFKFNYCPMCGRKLLSSGGGLK